MTMAKLSRDVLKDLVKECLVEILAEGLANNSETLTEAPTRNVAAKRKTTPRRVASDLISVGTKKRKPKTNPALEQRIKAASGGNNIMESILRDTAQNTLPHMVAAEGKEDRSIAGRSMAQRMTSGDAATKAMAATDPMDIFDGASNWATLAFADAPKK